MNKLLWQYLIYFGIFVCYVQIVEHTDSRWLHMDMKAIGTYAPLFLSALLIDITYRVGKRQNEIAERQTILQKEQNKIAEFEIYREIHRDIYKLQQQARLVLPVIHGYFASNTAKDQELRVVELEKIFTNLTDKIAIDEADFVLRKGSNEVISDAYRFACLAEYLLGIIPAYTKAGRPEQSDYNSLNDMRLQCSTDEDWVNGIMPYIAQKERLIATINQFVLQKQQLFGEENSLLMKIQDAYKNEL